MFWKKDNFWMGLVMGIVAPLLGILLFKMYNFKSLTIKETLQWMFYVEPGFKTLTVALSLSLLLNAVLFTIYINSHKDKTAKGIFTTTLVYGLFVLIVKTFL
jgi:L-cystine uptake protein TcyP (sodium:dicarboxylate symporter family)